MPGVKLVSFQCGHNSVRGDARRQLEGLDRREAFDTSDEVFLSVYSLAEWPEALSAVV